MSDFIPTTLVPPGVRDQRSRDFVESLSGLLEGFRTSALLVQEPLTVDARLLPVLTIELGMSEFLTAGLMEQHVRALLAAAPDIHAMTGTVAGVRRALAAIGVTVDWTQWWQQTPRGPHDTHQVIAFVNEHLFPDQAALLTAETQYAVLRLIRATQRWSQEIDFKLGVGFSSSAGSAGGLQSASTFSPSMQTVSQMPAGTVGPASSLERFAVCFPTAEAVSQHPAAALSAASDLCITQFVFVTMEAVA